MSQISIPDFLATLSLEQLEHCIFLAQAKCSFIRESEKVRLWVVSDDMINYKYFRESEWDDAFAYLCHIMKTETLAGRECNWNIEKISVYQSELESYLAKS